MEGKKEKYNFELIQSIKRLSSFLYMGHLSNFIFSLDIEEHSEVFGTFTQDLIISYLQISEIEASYVFLKAMRETFIQQIKNNIKNPKYVKTLKILDRDMEISITAIRTLMDPSIEEHLDKYYSQKDEGLDENAKDIDLIFNQINWNKTEDT